MIFSLLFPRYALCLKDVGIDVLGYSAVVELVATSVRASMEELATMAQAGIGSALYTQEQMLVAW